MECNGTITARPGCYEIRIVRLFPHAPGKLWEALTKPEKLVQSFTLLRPTWVIDVAERGKLKEDAKKRILEFQTKKQEG